MNDILKLVPLFLGVITIIAAIILFNRPLRRLMKFLLNSLFGLLTLLFLNFAGGGFGAFLAVNVPTIVTSVVLGLPGISALLLIKLFFKV